MTTPGRGRPATIPDQLCTELLDLIAHGATVGEAAAKLGIDRRTPAFLARRRGFRQLLDAAKAKGREARIPHGTENGYDNYDCRCTPCTAAATRARAERRHRADGDTRHDTTAETVEGTVLPWPAPNPDSPETGSDVQVRGVPSSFSAAAFPVVA